MMLNKKYTHTLKLCFFNNFKRLNKWFHLKKKKIYLTIILYVSLYRVNDKKGLTAPETKGKSFM